MEGDRIIDRIANDDWATISTDIEKITAKKIQDKIEVFKTEYRETGKFAEPEIEKPEEPKSEE